jgi:hypothetical protein
VWSIAGPIQEAPPALDGTNVLGQVPAGCQIAYTGIDDDLNAQFNQFLLDGVAIHTIQQGMVFSGQFAIPSAGNLTFVAEDSIGIWIAECENLTATATDMPTASPTGGTPTPTDSVTPTPTDSVSPTPTDSVTPTETSTPSAFNYLPVIANWYFRYYLPMTSR